MKRVMGIDIGQKRIGIAVSDLLGMTAQGIETYERKGESDAAYMVNKAKQLGADTIVAGLPLNMNGSEGPSALMAREFMEQIKGLGMNIAFQDERLTTVSAERTLIEADMSREKRRKVIDKLAAVYILETYMSIHPVR